VNITSALAGQKHTELAYLAGYLDGEGCFRVANTAIVSVSNTYPWTLVILQQYFGGHIRLHTRANKVHRTCYEWAVCGSKARSCITTLIPYLWEKREQAELILEIFKYPNKSRRRKTLKRKLKAKKRINYTLDRVNRGMR